MSGTVLIIGGAGFIGTNLASHLARNGHRVRIFDDLSRPGVDKNLAWLQRTYRDRIDPRIADICERVRIREAVHGVEAVFHLAAQTAVTTSLVDPMADFEVNARGTLEVLEAIRALRDRPPVIFTSTNKVYGCLPDLPLRITDGRWTPFDGQAATTGIDETRPLEPRTPHACSKASADHFVLDYAHSYGIPATVFRTSCIYGPHQMGTEDQGWVAHFLTRAIEGKPITIYGDGRQARDLLFADDLVDAFVRAWSRIGALAGRAFNIGGGPAHAISLLELLAMIEGLRGTKPEVKFEDWRPGDQRYYVSNTAAFTSVTGWTPRVGPRAGIEALHGWLAAQRPRVMDPSGPASGPGGEGRRA
jgi:CDP-paratose 2-epimerase